MNMTMEMQETFYSDPHFEFLFDSWRVDDHQKYAGALVALFLLGIFQNFINFVVNYLDNKRKK